MSTSSPVPSLRSNEVLSLPPSPLVQFSTAGRMDSPRQESVDNDALCMIDSTTQSSSPGTFASLLHAFIYNFSLILPQTLFQGHISSLITVLLPRKVALLSSNAEKGSRLALLYAIGAMVAAFMGPLLGISIDYLVSLREYYTRRETRSPAATLTALLANRRFWILAATLCHIVCIFSLGFLDYYGMLFMWFFVSFFVTVEAVAWSGWIASERRHTQRIASSTTLNVSRLAFFGFIGSAIGSQVGYIHNSKVAFASVALFIGLGMLVTLILGSENGESMLSQMWSLLPRRKTASSPASPPHLAPPTLPPADRQKLQQSRFMRLKKAKQTLSPLSMTGKSYSSMDDSPSIGDKTDRAPTQQPTYQRDASSSPQNTPSSAALESDEGLQKQSSSQRQENSIPSPAAYTPVSASPLASPQDDVVPSEEGDPSHSSASTSEDEHSEKAPLTSLFVDVDNTRYRSFRIIGPLHSHHMHEAKSFVHTLFYSLIAPLYESTAYRYLLLGNFLIHMGIDSVLSFLLFFFRDVYCADEIPIRVFDLQLTASSAVAFFTPFITVGSLASSLLFVLFPFMANHRFLWIMLSCALMMTLPGVLIMSNSRWFLALCAIGLLYGLGQGIFYCMNWVLAVQCVQKWKWKHSQTLGLWESCSIMGRFFSSIIGGLIIDRWLSVDFSWFGNNLKVSYLVVMVLSVIYFVCGCFAMLMMSFQLESQKQAGNDARLQPSISVEDVSMIEAAEHEGEV